MYANFIFRQAILVLLFIGTILPSARAETKQAAIDPVCKMKVEDSKFSYTYNSTKYYFCSAICQQSFEAAPDTYLSGNTPSDCLPAMPDYADSVNSGIIKQDQMKGSPRRTICQSFGTDYMKLDYGSPGVKDRVIWGGLVAYDKVWAGGAHNATKLTLMGNAVLGAKNELLGGEYAIFFIPGKDTWTVIINENFNQHLADDYDEKKDLFRIKVKPKRVKTPTQRLTYTITTHPKDKKAGILSLRWENVSIDVPFKMAD